ncbi:MAG: PD-(D/E)XK nuclease family protein [Clostridia bacterium]|nr:PD-(D/E)XK nuclease family protein [Clostridia bacterium]
MSVVLSPSNLQTFRQCPRQFYGKTVTRQIVWKPTKQKTRGTQMHTLMERAMRMGWSDDISGQFDNQVDIMMAKDTVDFVVGMRKTGWDLRIEHEMCVDGKCNPCGWWDEAAALRAKADVVLVPEDAYDCLFIGDIKTGKKYDNDHFQLRVEALLGHIIYGVKEVAYYYWYIDSGDIDYASIDFSRGLADVQDVLDTIRDCRQSIKNNYFPPTNNVFCKWCEWYKKKECGL